MELEKKGKFVSNFYVRFHYHAGSEMATYWGNHPYYAPFDTEEEAKEHIEEILNNNPEVRGIRIYTKAQMNKKD